MRPWSTPRWATRRPVSSRRSWGPREPGSPAPLSLVASRAEICSCDLEDPLGKTQPTVSHHTEILAAAGLIMGEKRGRWVWWRIEPERLAAIRKALGG